MSGGFGIFKSSGGGGGGGGGLTSLPIENTLYVAKNGSDSTGVRNDLSKPFLTIAGASAAASAGDAVYVYSGLYEETSANSFLGRLFYYLELGVTVYNEDDIVINDDSGAKTIRIYGEGVIDGEGAGAIKITNAASDLYLQCTTINSWKSRWAIDVDDAIVKIDVLNITLGEGGDGIRLQGNTRGYINFKNYSSIDAGGDNWVIDLDNAITRYGEPFLIKGERAIIDFEDSVGSGITIVVALYTSIEIQINEIEVLNVNDNYLSINSGRENGMVRIRNTRILTAPSTRDDRITIGGGFTYFSNVVVQGGGGIVLNGNLNNYLSMLNCNMSCEIPCIRTNGVGAIVFLMNSTFYSSQNKSFGGIISLGAAAFDKFYINNVLTYGANSSNPAIASLAAATIAIQGFFASNTAMTSNILSNIAGTSHLVDTDVYLNSTV